MIVPTTRAALAAALAAPLALLVAALAPGAWVLVPAAGGIGLVITAYEQRTRPGQLHVSHSEDLTPIRYGELRHP